MLYNETGVNVRTCIDTIIMLFEEGIMSLPVMDLDYLTTTLVDLLHIPSPTGFTHRAVAYVEAALGKLGLPFEHTRKGALIAHIASPTARPPRAITGHVDTLGAMVKAIKPNGRLRLTRIGGFAWNTVEGEGCRVFTRSGREITGSILVTKASSHVYGQEVGALRREPATMEVRLDERVTSAADVRALGVEVGDFVAFDPRVVITPSGFIRSRHLDDKGGVAAMLTAAKALVDAGQQPPWPILLHFSNYEEVGHGAASDLPADLAELVAVDMATVGDGQASDEFHVTICAKDSGGPYHHGLTSRLRELADAHQIPYKVDVYPYYSSDSEAYWRAGGAAAIALIGPGLDASHNYERTHMEALSATAQLILAYMLHG